jgi:hypothetical protein
VNSANARWSSNASEKQFDVRQSDSGRMQRGRRSSGEGVRLRSRPRPKPKRKQLVSAWRRRNRGVNSLMLPLPSLPSANIVASNRLRQRKRLVGRVSVNFAVK